MNSLLILLIGLPLLEIWLLIKIGANIGALNTISLIFLTAIVGIYFARLQGYNTLKSGFVNIYQNKTPVFEIISGASIAIAAGLLILPGFITDSIGFILLIPFTRKLMIILFLKNKDNVEENKDIIEAEIIEDKKDES